jgi:hypothetical protein
MPLACTMRLTQKPSLHTSTVRNPQTVHKQMHNIITYYNIIKHNKVEQSSTPFTLTMSS